MPARTPVRTLGELRARWGEAEPVGEMRDFRDGLVVVGVIGATPVILKGAPVILGTPELDAEFVRLWRPTCRLAGIREVPGA